MLIIYILISLFISWIWIDYFRLIDVFEKEKITQVIITFCLGCLSVLIVLGVSELIDITYKWELSGNYFNDFFYSWFKIGLVEEIAKIIPLLIAIKLFKSSINEPIDYIAFACVAALGFAGVENVLYYYHHGVEIITGRAILCAVGHMSDTAILAYGVLRVHYLKKNKFEIILFLLLASFVHGFYDFWLISEKFEGFGWIITILFFLITISVFATIINNCLNNSPFFDYKKIVNSELISKKLLIYYGVLFIIQLILIGYLFDVKRVILFFLQSLNYTAFIIVITCLRLSRMKLIQNRWNPIKIEFPFYYIPPYFIKIKGDSFNETIINKFYNEDVEIHPLSYRNTFLDDVFPGYIENKIFLANDDTYYHLKLYNNEEKSTFKHYLLKPKTNGMKLVDKEHPIAALLEVDNNVHINDIEQSYFDEFEFVEWVFLKY